MNAETRAKYRNAPVTQYIDCALNPVYTPMPWPPLKNTMEPFVSVKPEHLKDLLDAADDRDRYLALLKEIDLRLQGRQNYWVDEIKEIVTQALKEA